MNNWIKIQTFDRIHQAEMRKQILEANDIPAVIINERDSLFLLGDVELYVHKDNEKTALALIDDFKGLTKINSFIELKPIERFRQILDEAGIQTFLKRKEDARYVKNNFELYVKNTELERVIPFLTGESLTGWTKIQTSRKVRQAKYYIDLLADKNINSLTIKKKDSDFHLSEIYIYVPAPNQEVALEITEKLAGWETVRHSEVYSDIETLEENLAKNGIRGIIKRQNERFSLYVHESETIKADEILNLHAKWVTILSLPNIVSAKYIKSVLEAKEISAVIVNEKDSSFMLGEIEIMVQKRHEEEALSLINELQSIES